MLTRPVVLAGLLALMILSIPGASPARATELTLGGLVFSDELGGVRLLEGSGTGTLDDPVVLVEEIVDYGPAVIVIRGMHASFGNRIRSQHDVGFAITKVVRNATSQPWTLFTLELREKLLQESPFGDGLSFGQASEAGRPFLSDRFNTNLETREPYDGVQFYDGVVEPGETVVLNFVITDTTPRWKFYLMQKRDNNFVRSHPPEGVERANSG
ncbi:MAG: hypothetical protein OEU92_19695 [Alphaproteobacteria bacterium]|nr:hypothetical protein [Alphaproteobacteria bacterium]